MNSAQLTVYTQPLCLSLLLGSLPYKNSGNRRRGVRVVPRAVSQATSIQSPSLNISQPVTFTSPPALSVCCNPHKGVLLERTELLLCPFLIRQPEGLFFFPLSVLTMNIFLFLLVFILFAQKVSCHNMMVMFGVH